VSPASSRHPVDTVQDVGPEFESHFHQKKKKTANAIGGQWRLSPSLLMGGVTQVPLTSLPSGTPADCPLRPERPAQGPPAPRGSAMSPRPQHLSCRRLSGGLFACAMIAVINGLPSRCDRLGVLVTAASHAPPRRLLSVRLSVVTLAPGPPLPSEATKAPSAMPGAFSGLSVSWPPGTFQNILELSKCSGRF
jgi:hypothetical protein